MQLAPAPAHRRVASFLAVGAVTTAAYAVLFALSSPLLGAQLANAAALLVTADANTVANRRWSFGIRGGDGARGHRVRGGLAFGVTWALTAVALLLMPDEATSAAGIAVLVLANAVGGALHYLLLDRWSFRVVAVGSPATA